MNENNQISELEQTQQELKRSQLQIAYLLEELEQFHFQNSRIQQELLISQTQQKQAAVDLKQTQSRLNQVEGELQQVRSQLNQAQHESGRLSYLQKITTEAQSENEQKYQALVYEAWCAYQQNNLEQMVRYLRKSLRWSSVSLTQTVENWLESLGDFSRQSGKDFNMRSVISSPQWRELISNLMMVYRNQAS